MSVRRSGTMKRPQTMRKFRIIKDMVFNEPGTGRVVCEAGTIVEEVTINQIESHRARESFRKMFSDKSRRDRPTVLFMWRGKARAAIYGTDLVVPADRSWCQ